ncbi:type VI secretion system Vgr family protein [Nannocystis bainbridge]|uniref:Type VI secretion system tip protein TssI/VgrG n=1 Tax=Nannocystis bainbridge TaxID=2995303 RepID=A0ABT5E8N3_9BACT|nr:type VI secretion system tip protein TssI/VgrG [Nannocystis bainbridge]MDC0721704.1 type VI secretion system tip protein TssI/VgrG [Nannocystis bainbridge]
MFTLTVKGCDEELRVVRFSGHEAISSLFEFVVEIASPTLPLDALAGRFAVLSIEGLHATRHIHAFICEAGYIGESSSYTLCELKLVPAIWRLLQRVGCRIFQELTTPQILAKVLETAGIARSDFRFDLRANYVPHGYCAQYRESDFDFISRLMEQSGIFYYFEHREDKHVVTMTDHGDFAAPIPGDATLRLTAEDEQERILQFRLTESVRPRRVTVRDKSLHQPGQPMEATAGAGADSEIYEYPGAFTELGKDAPHKGDQQARLRLEALQATRRRGSGTSDSPRLTPGLAFTLADATRTHLEGDYRIIGVVHRGEQPQALDEGAAGHFHYGNQFECADKRIPYRAPRVTPSPVVHGAQTATVVGPGGEEVFVDEHGRVKVQFHWDRRGAHDEGSSCWVRVSQAWAGSGFGAMFIPRIGHEVVVEFLEGDPNRPLITGRVYTGFNTPPYSLPDEKTKSGIKSESTPGGGGSNELRFEDAKGREEIYLHGQKDWNIVVEHDKSQQIGHDVALQVGHDRSEVIGGDHEESIAKDKRVRVGNDHTEAIGRTMNLSVGANLIESVGGDASHAVAGSSTETIGATKHESVALASVLEVGGAYQISVIGAMNESVGLAKLEEVGLIKFVAVGKDSSEQVGGGKSVSAVENITESAGENIALSAGKHVNVTAGQNINLASGKNAAVVAADKLVLQCGDATITMKKNGEVTIQAKKLSVKASGEVAIKGSKIKLN